MQSHFLAIYINLYQFTVHDATCPSKNDVLSCILAREVSQRSTKPSETIPHLLGLPYRCLRLQWSGHLHCFPCGIHHHCRPLLQEVVRRLNKPGVEAANTLATNEKCWGSNSSIAEGASFACHNPTKVRKETKSPGSSITLLSGISVHTAS